ncbi:MAG: hypothetical protein MUE82_00005, partial [Chloroflexi bacterium]|nr:hypothetical protein [Chloroflexota bacterium]
TWAIQPVVSVLDAQGDVVTTDSATIVLLDIAPGSPQAGGPGTLGCTSGLSARVHRGVARFAGCSIGTPGTYYQLRARTYSTGSTLVLTDISLPFDIGGGNTPARALFTTEPLGATLGGAPPTAPSGTPWAVQPVVSILDASGRLVRDDSETVVAIAIDGSSLPTTGRLDCAGGTTVQVLGGVAAFTGCQIAGAAGGYVLRATARAPGGALTSDLSLPFTITAATSSLELSPSTLTVGPGGSVTLTATLAGTGNANQPIAFERDGPDDAGWVTIGTSPTDGSGQATFSTTVPYTSGFRAVFAGSGSLAAATSAPDMVAVAARVTLAPGTASVKKGTTIRYVAAVAPVPLGATVVQFHVWRYVSGSWAHVTQRSARVAANGTATLSWTWATAGRWRIAVIAPTTAYSTQGRSRVIPITVR